jgi:hypothetical protein
MSLHLSDLRPESRRGNIHDRAKGEASRLSYKGSFHLNCCLLGRPNMQLTRPYLGRQLYL